MAPQILKEMKYPGAVVKRTIWQKLSDWFWTKYYNWRYPMRLNLTQEVHENQELVDKIYKEILYKTEQTIMPPITRKD